MLARCIATSASGAKSGEIAKAIFGDEIENLKYYWLKDFELNGIPLIISRTGWSSELGYEIYLRDGSRGNELWDHIMEIGKPIGLYPGHTSTIRRIEGGMLSYQADMDCNINPFELGLDRLVDLEMDADFIGKECLKKNQKQGSKTPSSWNRNYLFSDTEPEYQLLANYCWFKGSGICNISSLLTSP